MKSKVFWIAKDRCGYEIGLDKKPLFEDEEGNWYSRMWLGELGEDRVINDLLNRITNGKIKENTYKKYRLVEVKGK